MEAVAAQSFLGLLKSTLGNSARSVPPESARSVPSSTHFSAPPQSPFTEAPPFFPPPLHPQPPPPPPVPIVLTIKINGTMVGARTTLSVLPTATWEAVLRTRLEACVSPEEAASYARMPLTVSRVQHRKAKCTVYANCVIVSILKEVTIHH